MKHGQGQPPRGPSGRRLQFALLSLLLALSLSGAVGAQNYESALLDGVAARDRALETESERDWQRALQHFTRAAQIEPTKEAEFELAQAASHLGLWAIAVTAYEAALARGLQGKARTRAQEFLNAHATQIARVELVGPEGAQVWVDDQPRGVLPLPLPLVVAPGELRLRFEQPGFQRRELRVQATAAAFTHVEVTLEPLAVPPTAERAAAPEHTATTDPRTWPRLTTIAGSALGLAGVGTFTASSLLLSSARRDLAEACDQPDPKDSDHCLETAAERRRGAQSAANRVLTYGNLRWAGVAGAAVGLSVGVVGLVQLLSMHDAEPARAELEWTPECWSLVWRGRF